MESVKPILLLVALLLASLPIAWSGEVPPSGSKQLTEVEFDDGF